MLLSILKKNAFISLFIRLTFNLLISPSPSWPKSKGKKYLSEIFYWIRALLEVWNLRTTGHMHLPRDPFNLNTGTNERHLCSYTICLEKCMHLLSFEFLISKKSQKFVFNVKTKCVRYLMRKVSNLQTQN